MTITKITHIVLVPPPRSRLRKMSPRTQNRHMNHAKNKKNSKRASRNEPLSLNIEATFQSGRNGGSHRPMAAACCHHRPETSPETDETSTQPPPLICPRATVLTG